MRFGSPFDPDDKPLENVEWRSKEELLTFQVMFWIAMRVPLVMIIISKSPLAVTLS